MYVGMSFAYNENQFYDLLHNEDPRKCCDEYGALLTCNAVNINKVWISKHQQGFRALSCLISNQRLIDCSSVSLLDARYIYIIIKMYFTSLESTSNEWISRKLQEIGLHWTGRTLHISKRELSLGFEWESLNNYLKGLSGNSKPISDTRHLYKLDANFRVQTLDVR